MLSKQLHEAINAQINAELWSAYLYSLGYISIPNSPLALSSFQTYKQKNMIS